MNRSEILTEAQKVITKDRQDQYGKPENCFKAIADYWGLYLRCHLDPKDVAMMMVLLKVARNDANPSHTDNYVDICGYAALAGEMSDMVSGDAV